MLCRSTYRGEIRWGKLHSRGGVIGTDLYAHGSAGHRRHVAHHLWLEHKRRGPTICPTRSVSDTKSSNRTILDAIVDVLHPRVFEAAVGKALEILTQERGERRTKVEAELTKTQLRIDRLVGALADATLPADDIKPAAQRGEIEAAPLLMWK